MYRTPHQVRLFSAAIAAVVGLGLVATAGGALSEERAPLAATKLDLVKLDPVVITLHASPRVASGCSDSPKAAL